MNDHGNGGFPNFCSERCHKTSSAGTRLKVLLVEDDEDDCILVQSFLSEVSSTSYELEWARTYEEALEAIDRPYDVCLLDYRLDYHSGLDLLKAAANKGNGSRLPIIFLTAQTDYKVDMEALRFGAADYLSKSQISADILDRSIRYAIEHKRMEEELKASIIVCKNTEVDLRRANRALKTLNKCNQALVRRQEESDLLNDICRIIVEDGGYRLAWVGFAERDEAKRVRPVAEAGYEQGYIDTVHITWADKERGRGPTGIAVRTGKPCSARDILTQPDYDPWRAEALKRGFASSIALPLIANGEVFGALTIYAVEHGAFDEEEVNLLSSLADNLSYGIVALRTLAERRLANRLLRESEEKYRMIFEHSPLGIFHFDRNGIVTACNDNFLKMVHSSKRRMTGFNLLASLKDEMAGASILSCLSGKRSQYEGYYGSATGGRITAMKAEFSPVLAEDGSVLGGIGIVEDITERKQAEEALQLSEKQLRLLSSKLLTAQEEERKRLAIELHDSIGSSLAGCKFRVQEILRAATAGETKDFVKSLEHLVPIFQATIDEARRIYMGLRPSILDDLGIIATINWFCREFRATYPSLYVECEIGVEEQEIPEAHKITIFRVIQESFNNLAKYSKAELVNISLARKDDAVELIIEDNGVGFDVNAVRRRDEYRGGLGLTSMKERVELSGGVFAINSVPGEGTVIRASWPCS